MDRLNMSTLWQTFIDSYPKNSFSDTTIADRVALCDLSQLSLLKVSGNDAEQFLQGQLTNDIKQLTEGRTHLTAYCTAKGRMLAIFRAHRNGENIYLQAPSEVIESVQKRLQMFTIMSDVKLENISEQQAQLGLMGDTATTLLAANFHSLPKTDNSLIQCDSITLIRHPGRMARYQIIAPPAQLKELCQAWLDNGDVVDPSNWSLLDIRAGIPNIYSATQESFVPQMTNLHLIDGVSFTKGCYVGQEIVARMQYLGKQKRHMQYATVITQQRPKVGDQLFSATSQSTQGAGNVVDVQTAGEQYELLVVVEDESAANNDLQLTQNGSKLEIGKLPYELLESDSD